MKKEIDINDYKKCFINFSYDERVYVEDISKIIPMIHKYPSTTFYSCEPHWNEECQTFCLAHSIEEAKKMFEEVYPLKDEEMSYDLKDFFNEFTED